jgi:hypothetical protein
MLGKLLQRPHPVRINDTARRAACSHVRRPRWRRHKAEHGHAPGGAEFLQPRYARPLLC